MPQADATQISGLRFYSRSALLEQTAHEALLDVGWSVSPQIEDTAADTILLDVSGLGHLFPSLKLIAERLTERALDCGLRPQVAVAPNADAAWLAARGFPGVTVIERGEEAAFLGRLPVGVLGAAPEIEETLERWGIYRCADLACLKVLDLSERFGQEGVRLHALARGGCARALSMAEPAHSFTERMELDDSVAELDPLSFILGRLLDQLCARLASRSLAAAVLHVRFELDPAFEATFDPCKELFRRETVASFFATRMEFPIPMRDSKLLLKLLRLHLQANPPCKPICKAELTAEAARPRFLQKELFAPGFPDPEKLELTIARIAHLVGQDKVGSPSLPDTHRPNAFQMDRFCGSQTAEAPLQENAMQDHTDHTVRLCKGFRTFRPPIPLTVGMRDLQPAHVFFHGKRGTVRSASGPWRTSGEWWEESPWDHEEWDVELLFPVSSEPSNGSMTAYPQSGIYRIFKDVLRDGQDLPGNGQDLQRGGHWFAEGIYD
jgi:protein ImuB